MRVRLPGPEKLAITGLPGRALSVSSVGGPRSAKVAAIASSDPSTGPEFLQRHRRGQIGPRVLPLDAVPAMRDEIDLEEARSFLHLVHRLTHPDG